MINFIGIDPGVTGAAVLLNSEGTVLSVQDTPTIQVAKGKGKKTVYIESQMVAILQSFLDSGKIHGVGIENVHSMPGQGVTSMFSMGMGFGLWLGIISALKIPYTKIEPMAWKKLMNIPPKSDKGASIVRAHQLFPGVSFMRDRGRVENMHGRADALLIAEYIRRSINGSTTSESKVPKTPVRNAR